jgi:selenide,water dikinase
VLAKAYRHVHALTDVTGFGLLGHLDSMMRASGGRAVVQAGAVRVLPGVRELCAQGLVPAGTRANLEFVAPRARFSDALSEIDRLVLADAQTNGGMLAAVAPRHASRLLRALADAGAPAERIGEVAAGEPGIDVIGTLAA